MPSHGVTGPGFDRHTRLILRQILQRTDLCKAEHYAKHHIPGAAHLAYEKLVAKAPPVGGLLPGRDEFARLTSDLGVSSGQR